MEDDAYEGSILLPPMKVCPFCGSAKLKVQTVWNEFRYVSCRKCRAAGPVVKIVKHNVGKADEDAIVRWNHSNYRAPDILQMQIDTGDIVSDLNEIEIFINDILDNLNDIQINSYPEEIDIETIFRKVDNAQGAACECGRVVKEMRNEEAERGHNDVT